MARVLISFMVMTIFLTFASPFPDGRAKRHADGLFTSRLSEILNKFAVRNYVNSKLASKRSVPEWNFPDKFEDNATRSEDACFNWLYQNFLSESLSANDAEEAIQSYKLICQVCQPLGHVLQSLEDYIPPVKSLEGKL